MNKINKILTSTLALFMLITGILKFVNPFKAWYKSQIVMSHLPFPTLSYWLGQIGEIFIGIALLCFVIYTESIRSIWNKRFFILVNLGIVAMMLGACYVHLHPNVPSGVLPLKIKPPYIPGILAILAIINILAVRERSEHDC